MFLIFYKFSHNYVIIKNVDPFREAIGKNISFSKTFYSKF